MPAGVLCLLRHYLNALATEFEFYQLDPDPFDSLCETVTFCGVCK